MASMKKYTQVGTRQNYIVGISEKAYYEEDKLEETISTRSMQGRFPKSTYGFDRQLSFFLAFSARSASTHAATDSTASIGRTLYDIR